MKVLLVFGDDRVRNLLTFVLESKFSMEVSAFKAPQETINWFQNANIPELLICDHPVSSQAMFKYLDAFRMELPTVVCPNSESVTTGAFENRNIIGYARLASVSDDVVAIVTDFCKKMGEAFTVNEREFCRIRTDLLLKVGALQSDVYIRLSPSKLLRIFRKGDVFEITDHQKLTFKHNIEYLYIKSLETDQFVVKLKNDLAKELDAVKNDANASRELAARIYDTIQQLALRLGPQPVVQKLVRMGFASTLLAVGKNPSLKQTLSYLAHRREQYQASHSLMLSQVSCALAAAMGWISEATFNKLNFAAFFHDMTLDNEMLTPIQTLKELQTISTRLTPQQIQSYKLHPIHAAQIAAKFEEVPNDVETLITQHHERPDGSGFPHSLLAGRISPLASLFIVAHEIVTDVYRSGGGFDIERFLGMARANYTQGSFKQILRAIEKPGVLH